MWNRHTVRTFGNQLIKITLKDVIKNSQERCTVIILIELGTSSRVRIEEQLVCIFPNTVHDLDFTVRCIERDSWIAVGNVGTPQYGLVFV